MPLEQRVKVLIKNLSSAGLSISTAESCTGGGIAAAITSVSGSSAVFNGSVVAYSNRVKTEILQVSGKTLLDFGAVSEEVVTEMAIGVAKLMRTEVAIATSGVAGPTGGTPSKPIGLVSFAIYKAGVVDTFTKTFSGDRENIQKKAISHAIEKITKAIQS